MSCPGRGPEEISRLLEFDQETGPPDRLRRNALRESRARPNPSQSPALSRASASSRRSRASLGQSAPGVGAEIAAGVAEKGVWDLEAPVVRVTGYDTVMPLFRLEYEDLPSVARIIDGVHKTFED